MILEGYDLMCDIENNPIKYGAKQISYQALILHKGKSKVVLVMTKDSIEIFISVVFIIDCII